MTTNDRALAADAAPGSRPADEAPRGSSPEASIPSADELAARLADPIFQREQAAQLLATEIGYQLRCVRILRGLTIVELSAESGVGVATIKAIERGEWLKGLRVLANIAHALDCAITVKMVPREPANCHPEHVPSFDEEDTASRIEARSDETLPAAQPVGREPDPQGDAQDQPS